MENTDMINPFTEVATRGIAIYNEQLKNLLEPAQNGKAVAINVDNRDYAVADTLKEARALLHARYPGIVSMSRTIGVETDYGLLSRILAGGKQPLLVGEFRNKMPRLPLLLPGRGDDIEVTFVLDTGFNGDFALPLRVIHRLQASPYDTQTHLMADGTQVPVAVYLLEMDWLDEVRSVEVLALEGNPLFGTGLLIGCHIDIDANEGGEVIIEAVQNQPIS